MKVGILTYHRSHNYGAFMQAYSLSNKINSIEGIQCEIIDYNLKLEEGVYEKRKFKRPIYWRAFSNQDKSFKKSLKKQLLSKNTIITDNLDEISKEINGKYDILVVGSDEIWRIGSRGCPNIYWLPGELNAKKMSYAASSRMKYDNLDNEKRTLLKNMYNDFNYIGVRDNISKDEISKLVPEKVVNRNCDPAFLYNEFKSKEEIRKTLYKKYNIDISKKIVGIMYDRPEIITKLRKYLGKDYEFISVYRPMWNADKNLNSLTPFEWVDFIGGCDFFVSCYFHGVLFALNQNTPFIAIDRRVNRGNLETSKLFDILKYENIDDKYYIESELNEKVWNKISLDIKNYSDGIKIANFDNVVERQRNLFESFYNQLIDYRSTYERK